MMVVGEGFEPSKSMTADLQSAPFGRSGTPPGVMLILRYSLKMVVEEGLFVASLLTLPDKCKLHIILSVLPHRCGE